MWQLHFSRAVQNRKWRAWNEKQKPWRTRSREIRNWKLEKFSTNGRWGTGIFLSLSHERKKAPRKATSRIGGLLENKKKKWFHRPGLVWNLADSMASVEPLVPTHPASSCCPRTWRRWRFPRKTRGPDETQKKNSTSTRLSSLVRWATVWPFNCLPSASHKRRGPRASSHLKHAVGSPWRSRMDSETNIPKDGDMCIHSFGFVPFRPTQRPASNNRRQYGKRKTIVVTSQRRKKQKRTQDETKRIKKQKWSAQKEWKAEKKEGTAETAIYVRCNTCTILPRAPGLDGKILLPPENKK